MNNLSIQNLNRLNNFSDIYDVLSSVVMDELNIYNQAYLELDQPLIKNEVFHKNTKYEIPITFSVEGDMNGQIICLLDSYKKDIEGPEKEFFLSLYVESMNILLGKMMTELEEKYNITALLSSPTKPKEGALTEFNKSTMSLLAMGYKLIHDSVEYDCRIIFKVKKKRIIEV